MTDALDQRGLDELIDLALQQHLIDHYDTRGLCVVIERGERTYTSSREQACRLLRTLLRQAGRTPPAGPTPGRRPGREHHS